MKKLTLLFAAFIMVLSMHAQSSKQVKWSWSAKKIGDKTYEVHLTANIIGDYHLYAQDAGGEGPVPTTFTFSKNPLFNLEGNVKEVGKQVKKFESAWSHDVKYYENTVDFVQVVKLKGNAKTNLAGKVEFMVCNNEKCLPPADVNFQVGIGG